MSTHPVLQNKPQLLPFWQGFCASGSVDRTPFLRDAFYFDDNAQSADALAELVLTRRKRATASLLWAYEAEQAALPALGG
jgi:uncharacterized protein YhfF